MENINNEIEENKNPIVILETNKGTIKIELYPNEAPLTVENFLAYVEDKHYENLIFHRVIKGFMIQGGGFTKEGIQKETREAIPIESNNGLKNIKGTIAMARTNDPNSATSQFFINVVNNSFLNYENERNPGYTVFGKVIEGMEVVTKVENVRTGNKNMHSDWPIEDIIIKKVYKKIN